MLKGLEKEDLYLFVNNAPLNSFNVYVLDAQRLN